ncbi:hypothetical protein OHV05_00680 [Kitasatospora sp. NBC_00070]|uniref:hypothetical protein n=1 Tax=Kitasatospora sp. NBC_00070 TaxID=2975962 RepID=UPI0032443543
MATAFRHPLRGPVDCPAAELVGGVLARRGFEVRFLAFDEHRWDEGDRERAGGTVMSALSFRLGDGRVLGLAAAGAGAGEEAARAAVEEWATVLRTRRMMVAGADPLCPGERAEAETIRRLAAAGRSRLFVLGTPAWGRLHGAGRPEVQVVRDLAAVPDGATVVIAAAGVAAAARSEAVGRGLEVVDATCPLVGAAHREVRRMAGQGETVLVVGHAKGPAAGPMLGQAPQVTALVEVAAQADGVPVADPGKVGVVIQPGLPLEEAERLAERIRARFGHVIPQDPATYCHAVSDRRAALRSLAERCDLLLAVGPSGDPDVARTLAVARAGRAVVRHVERASDIEPHWLEGVAVLGLAPSSGAHPGTAAGLLSVLEGLGPSSTDVHEVTTRPWADADRALVPGGEPLALVPEVPGDFNAPARFGR